SRSLLSALPLTTSRSTLYFLASPGSTSCSAANLRLAPHFGQAGSAERSVQPHTMHCRRLGLKSRARTRRRTLPCCSFASASSASMTVPRLLINKLSRSEEHTSELQSRG